MNTEVKGEQHNVGINDELSNDIKKKQIEALYKELKHFDKTLAEVEEGLADAKEAQEIDLKMYELVFADDGFKKVQPEFVYETRPEYWELKKRQLKIQQKSFVKKAEDTIKNFEKTVQTLKEQQASARTKLVELGEIL